MSQSASRSARLEARLTPDALAIVRRAAELQGCSVSDFVVIAAQEAAERAIEQAHVIRLSVGDQQHLARAILDPPLPSPGLARAIGRHGTVIAGGS